MDAAGAAYVTGYTTSSNFPTHQAFQGTFGGGYDDAFVTKFMAQPPPYLARPLIDYSRALNNPVLTFDSGGQALWFRYFSLPPPVDLAQSGDIGDYRYSWLQTTVNGPGVLAFDWQVSSQANHDYLQVWVNGLLHDQISGSTARERHSLTLGPGAHLIQWQYVKDGSLSSFSDCGFLDKVAFTPGGISFPKALDNRLLTFTSGGDSLWQGESTTSQSGGSAARSGPIGNNQTSWLETTVAGPGELSFYWQTSCQAVLDYLEFSINGVFQTRITSPSQWRRETFSLPAGWNNLRWTYKKDGSAAVGQDCGFLDRVVFISALATNLNNVLDNQDLGFETGGDRPWVGQTTVFNHGGSAAASGVLTHNQHSWLKTVVTGPGKVSFHWKVSSETGFDLLEFYLDGYLQETISGAVDWTKKQVVIPPGDHALVWLYIKDSQVSLGDDRGYLDQVVFTPFSNQGALMLLLLE